MVEVDAVREQRRARRRRPALERLLIDFRPTQKDPLGRAPRTPNLTRFLARIEAVSPAACAGARSASRRGAPSTAAAAGGPRPRSAVCSSVRLRDGPALGAALTGEEKPISGPEAPMKHHQGRGSRTRAARGHAPPPRARARVRPARGARRRRALALALAGRSARGVQPKVSTGGRRAGRAYASATLTGSVNPNGSDTSYYFQYGPTRAYGGQTRDRRRRRRHAVGRREPAGRGPAAADRLPLPPRGA